jgi:hypothetical protein
VIERPWLLVGLVAVWLLYLAAVISAAVVLPTMPADWRVF